MTRPAAKPLQMRAGRDRRTGAQRRRDGLALMGLGALGITLVVWVTVKAVDVVEALLRAVGSGHGHVPSGLIGVAALAAFVTAWIRSPRHRR